MFTIEILPVNDAPTFQIGRDATVDEDTGTHQINGFISSISAGPLDPSQSVTFQLSVASPALFRTQPAMSPSGTLSFELEPDAFGTTSVDVVATDAAGRPGAA